MLLNPAMAWLGAAAVSVPVVIHLLNKRKFERVIWAAMRFLRVSIEQNQRRLQIEDIILLALRCLLLLILGLALARPTLRSITATGWLGEAKITAVVLLDNSYSMSATDGTKSRFDLAKDAADQAIAALPIGSSVSVLLASDVAPTGPIPEPTYDLSLARKLVRDSRICDRATNLYPAIRKAVQTLQEKRAGTREIYLCTDSQSLGWRQFDQIRQLFQDTKNDIQSHLLLVGSKLDRNIGVSGLRMVSPLAITGEPLHFQVQLTNYGKNDEADVRVRLHVDDEASSDEQSIDKIPPGASRSVSLFAKLKSDGGHAVTASIEKDRLPADDVRTVAVRAISQIKILLVDGEPGGGGRESETFYLRNALLPVPRNEVPNYFNKITTIPSQELETTRLDEFDAVFLCNVTDFSEKTAEGFADLLKRGGGLVIFPGEQCRPRVYNETLGQKYQILPATLGEASGDATRDDQFVTIQDKNFDHPIASLWNDPGAGILNLHFFRRFELTPLGDEKTGPEKTTGADGVEIGRPRTVLRFADGKPAMMERGWGAGRVVVMASTADTSWNDLGARPNVFIPLVHRTLGSIIARQDESLNVKVGSRFAWRAEARMLGREAMFAPPGVRIDDPTRVDRSKIGLVNNVPLLAYEETSLAGAYQMKLGGDDPMSVTFAAQSDPDESRLDELTEDQLKDVGQVIDAVRWQGGSAELGKLLATRRTGTELWKFLALTALVLATTEVLLAHWFSKPK